MRETKNGTRRASVLFFSCLFFFLPELDSTILSIGLIPSERRRRFLDVLGVSFLPQSAKPSFHSLSGPHRLWRFLLGLIPARVQLLSGMCGGGSEKRYD